MLAGNNHLEPGDDMRVAHEIVTRAATPGEIIGEMVLVQPIAAQSELQILLKEEVLVAERNLPAKNPIIGSGAESQVMAVNPAFRRPFYLHFVELFLQPAAVSGGK